jgi:hypothetical protein
VRTGRRGLEPGQEPGQRLIGHGQFEVLDVSARRQAKAVGLRLDRYLDDDAASAERRGLRRAGRPAGDHMKRAPVENVLRPQQHAERAVPAQRVMLVGKHAEAPAARAPRLAQGALDGPAASLKQVAAGGEDDGSEDNEHQDGGKQPYRVRQRAHHLSNPPCEDEDPGPRHPYRRPQGRGMPTAVTRALVSTAA